MAENARTRTGSLIAETTIDIPTSSAPSAPSGQARLYFDSGDNKLKLAENGGSFTDVITTDSRSAAQKRYAIDATKVSNAGHYSVSAWSLQTAAINQTWQSICWSPELGMFAAVSSDGGTNQVMTSTNGKDWTLQASTLNSTWASICWAAELGIFVAVDLPSPHVIISSDGVSWSQHNAPISTWTSICWSPQLNLLVAVASDALGGTEIMTSTNGTTWTNRTEAQTNAWQSVCWSPELGLFLAVSSNGTNRVMKSTNGIAWTSATSIVQNSWQSVCWAAELGLFVAVSSDGSPQIMTSPDGTTWTSQASLSGTWHSVVWAPELNLLVSISLDNNVMVSSNGIDWVQGGVPSESNQWSSICWSPELSLFVAVSRNGTHRVVTSRRFENVDPQNTQSNGAFIAAGDAQARTFVQRVITTNNVASNMFMDGNGYTQMMTLPAKYATWYFRAKIVGQTVPTADVAAYTVEGVIQRTPTTNSTTLLTSGTSTTVYASGGASGWIVSAGADAPTDSLVISVTGALATTIHWVAQIETVETFATS